jgi:hypothetical protein
MSWSRSSRRSPDTPGERLKPNLIHCNSGEKRDPSQCP